MVTAVGMCPPALHAGMNPREWFEDFSSAFAVTSEYFFEQPTVLQGQHPEVHRLFCACFQQDPEKRRIAAGSR